jgi:hypothetical protein
MRAGNKECSIGQAAASIPITYCSQKVRHLMSVRSGGKEV